MATRTASARTRRTSGSTRRRLRVVVLVQLLAAMGCSASDGPPATAGRACGGDGPPCFDLGNESNLYCHVRQVRDLLQQGRLELSDLPGWVDDEERGGVPVVDDFRREPADDRSAAEYLADLLGTARAAGADFDRRAVSACSRDLTQEQVRRSEGGWPER